MSLPSATRTVSLLLLFSMLQVACAKTSIAGLQSGPAIDTATLAIGEQQFTFDACNSGDLQHFLGVDLVDQRGGAAARVVIDPLAGPRVRIAYGTGQSRQRLELTPAQCRQFAADVRPTNWIVNTVRDVSGFVDVECAGDPGPTVRLHARFSHCH